MSEVNDLQILRVIRGELTSGDTSGTVYTAISEGAVYMKKDRSEVLKDVEKKIQGKNK
jgi:hypothetical protein